MYASPTGDAAVAAAWKVRSSEVSREAVVPASGVDIGGAVSFGAP